jgi:hypothetical protein
VIWGREIWRRVICGRGKVICRVSAAALGGRPQGRGGPLGRGVASGRNDQDTTIKIHRAKIHRAWSDEEV